MGGKTWIRQVIRIGGALEAGLLRLAACLGRLRQPVYAYLVNTNGNVLVALSIDGGFSFAKVAEIVPTTPTGRKAPFRRHIKRLRPPSNNPNRLGDSGPFRRGREACG
jgi:hypothetical protein